MTRVTTDELLRLLEDHGIAVKAHWHPAVHTVEESQRLRGDIPGVHTKNLFVRDGKKRYFLLVTDEQRKVNLKALSARIGARGTLSFGSAEALDEKLGISPGAVSLFALINNTLGDVTVVIDEALLNASAINGHPLTNECTISVSPAGVLGFLQAIDRPAHWIDFKTPE